MATHTISEKLAPLIQYLDGLKERAPVDRLHEQLSAIDVTVDDVADFVHFSSDRYLRNLVHEGEWYHVLAMCWRSGQRSPIHNHAGSTCGVRVLQGVVTETVFAKTPCSLINAVTSHDMHVGEVTVTEDANIHQVSNLQTEGTDLITLHVYSPPLLRMDTYSLTEPTVGEFRPMVLEHSLGSGI